MYRGDQADFQKNFYNNGWKAFEKRRPLNSNPYPDKTLAFKSWAAGWIDRSEEGKEKA